MEPDVTIYTKNYCGYCTRAKKLLEEKKLEYREFNVSQDPEKREEMLERSGGARTLPQIFIHGLHVGGCDELYELNRTGELDEMIEQRSDGESSNEVHDVLILGSGCAGLTAALYNARANLQPLVLKGDEPGGQLTLTTDVENYPGFPEGIQGPDLMDRMEEQAERFGAELISKSAVDADLGQRPFEVQSSSGERYRARSLIVATGASARWLGLESEERYRGQGVSSCATCDGFFFQDDEVLVIGGGDTAMEEALFLTKFASRVRVLHRRDNLRASEILAERARNNDRIEFMWNTELLEVLGDGESVTGARIVQHPEGHPKERWEQNDPDVREREIECEGIFLGIGHEPNTEFLDGELEMDEEGYLVTEDQVFTNVEGVFAAGDVFDTRYRQAVTAAGSGCKAAMEAEDYLERLAHQNTDSEKAPQAATS